MRRTQSSNITGWYWCVVSQEVGWGRHTASDGLHRS